MRAMLASVLLGVTVALGAVPAGAQQGSRDISVGAAGPGGFYDNAWAVIIGINDYQHPRIPKLNYAINDARSVQRVLLSGGFRKDRITMLLDDQATKVQIEQVLGDDLRSKVRANDRVLVFFAGHGKTDRLRSGEEEGYLIPYDGDPGRLFSTGVSMTAIRQISDRMSAKQVLYIVDACYSGFAVFNRSISNDLYEEMVAKPAIQILTAGRQQDQAQERNGHGIFTQALLRALEGDAFSGKDWLSLEELGVYLKQRVYVESNRKQMPQYGNLAGEGQFVFRRPMLAATGPVTIEKVRPSAPTIRNEIDTGSIVVSARVPGIEISVGGRQIGQAGPGNKLVIDDLEVGRHRLVAKKEGYYDWETEVEVRPRQRLEIPIDMDSKTPQPTAVAAKPPDRSPTGPQKAPDVDVSRPGQPPIPGQQTGEMALVPGGEFSMGLHDGSDNERPTHKVFLDPFYIDRYEVTNRDFKAFVDAGGYDKAEIWNPAGWSWRNGQKQASLGDIMSSKSSKGTRLPRYWGEPRWSNDRQPVVGVSWYEADAYCRFVGKRLPTEAEWEKAARGPEGRRYPWGDYWDDRRANFSDAKVKGTSAVGSFANGASVYGVHDLAGNAAEWVADWYQSEYYKRSPEKNPQGPEGGGKKVIRGGSWDDDAKDLRSTRRRSDEPDERGEKIGFRCARSER